MACDDAHAATRSEGCWAAGLASTKYHNRHFSVPRQSSALNPDLVKEETIVLHLPHAETQMGHDPD